MTPVRHWSFGLFAVGSALAACTAAPLAPPEPDVAEVRRAAVWRERQSFPREGSLFGSAVALAGDTALIVAGAPSPGSSGVYAYERAGSEFGAAEELVPYRGAKGFSVALSGDTAVVGTPSYPGDGAVEVIPGVTGPPEGAASVFTRSAAGWKLTHTLVPSDPASGDAFGWSVAMSGDTVAVATKWREKVYTFTRSSSGWIEQKLHVSIVMPAEAGHPVALSGDELLVGTYGDNTVQPFTRSGASWRALPPIESPEPGGCRHFGIAVAIEGDTALIGDDCVAWEGSTSEGGVYVFRREESGWRFVDRLRPTRASETVWFGGAIALSGDTAVIGAPGSTVGGNLYQGVATVFTRSAESFVERVTLTQADGRYEDSFGRAVAVSGGSALIGASEHGRQSQQRAPTGSVTLWTVLGSNADACAMDAECDSGHCVDGNCCNTACDGACDACSVAAGASRDGRCALVAAGMPGSPVCDAPLACTGASTECAPCSSDAHCPLDTYCAANGACTAQKVRAASCDPAVECAEAECRICETGVCAQGVCCNTACEGECLSCAVPSRLGTCGALPTLECVPQATCQDADTLLGADGQSTVECAPYRCHADARTCGESCAASTDCAEGFVCDRDGACVSADRDVPVDGGGCGMTGTRRAFWHPTLILLASALLSRVRRRTRRPVGKRRTF